MYRITPLPLNEVKTGKWYYWVMCLGCNELFAIMDVKGSQPVAFVGAGRLLIKCPRCDFDGNYGTEEVKPFAAP